jgi:Leucine-rich repeat (LRR) protein
MLQDDPLSLALPTTHEDPFVQRYIVAVLVFAIAHHGNSDIKKAYNLLSPQQECLWNTRWKRSNDDHAVKSMSMGILCQLNDDSSDEDDDSSSPSSLSSPVVSETATSVTAIVLQSAGLEGTLPPELELLTSLKHVAMDGNRLGGEVPVMPYLTHLSLAYNDFTGYLPDHFSAMSRLEVFSMAENILQGSLPKSLSALTHLKLVALNGNELTGGLEEIYKLTSLEEIYMGYNSMEDHLSNGSFRKLTNLKVIDMKSNRLGGPLPDALWNMSKLEVIDFHHNALDGHINDVIIPHHPLKYLDISANILGGGLPPSTAHLRSLTHLDVSYNRFEVLLPQHFANMTKMKTLMLTENGMFGPQPIPHWLRNMKDLKRLSFRLTSRTGTLPTWFGELTHLELLDLDWNHVSGT